MITKATNQENKREMTNENFKPGDVVRLKSSGPKMSVNVVDEDNRQVECLWFTPEDKLCRQTFSAELLRKLGDRSEK